MDRTSLLTSMTLRLNHLHGRGDWRALQAADRQLATLLTQLAAQGEWLPAERRALGELRSAHQSVRQYCERELGGIGARLLQMRQSQEGWLAYAWNEEWECNP